MKNYIIFIASLLLFYVFGIGSVLYYQKIQVPNQLLTVIATPYSEADKKFSSDGLVVAINDYRIEKGLKQLAFPVEKLIGLSAVSAEYSCKNISHDGIRELAKEHPDLSLIELVVNNMETSRIAVNALKNSPSHNLYMLDPGAKYIDVTAIGNCASIILIK